MRLILPTFRGGIMIFIVLCSIGVAFVNVGLATALVASALTAFLLASFVLTFFSLYNLYLQRRPNLDGIRGENVILPVELFNKSNRCRQPVVILENCPFALDGVTAFVSEPLLPNDKIIISRQIMALKRGIFSMNRITVLGGDPAGLFFSRKHFKCPGEIVVYPENEKLLWLPLKLRRKGLPSTDGRLLGVSGQGQEFFGLREYRNQDEYRFIYWKATAAKKRLMVKEFEACTVMRITLLLDVEKKYAGRDEYESNFEFLVKTAGAISDYLSEMYCNVQFVTGAPDGSIIRLIGSASNIKTKIINSLATMTPANFALHDLLDATLDYIWPESIFYCLTLSEPDKLQERFEMLVERGIDVKWIYAPMEYFPLWVDGEPVRIGKKKKAVIRECNYGIMPNVVSWQTNLSAIFKNEQ